MLLIQSLVFSASFVSDSSKEDLLSALKRHSIVFQCRQPRCFYPPYCLSHKTRQDHVLSFADFFCAVQIRSRPLCEN